jgi:prefoldin subunit 5
MSDDYLYLPVQPASASLTSHIQALDLLAARLSSLQTRVEWETRVPLNSKASVKGRIVDTGNVKINIGGEWWVDMTPLEGEQWIRRRKTGMYRFYRGESADR